MPDIDEEPIDLEVQKPVDRCEWPELKELKVDGRTLVVLDLEGLKLQRSCQITEQANYDIALANARSTDEAVKAYNLLLDKAELYNRYSQNEIDRVYERQKEKTVEVFIYQTLLVLGLIAAVL
jgi:phosphotransacetylase